MTRSSDMSHDGEEEEILKIRWSEGERETNQNVVVEITKKHKDHTYSDKIVNVSNSESSSSAGESSPQSMGVDDAVATKPESSDVAESLDRPLNIVKKKFADSVTVAEIQNSSVTSSSDGSIEDPKEELDSELMESEICYARRRETAHKKYMDALHIKFLGRKKKYEESKKKYEESKEKYEESKQNREQLEELKNQRSMNSQQPAHNETAQSTD
ncbi:hypothetical protein HA402_001002 [Bradysia odoriphaga]|nr:hypothetical protein HA402_001002 [Bradysia odoriphaga]